jgi:hypothetical protein
MDLSITVNGIKFPNPFLLGSGPREPMPACWQNRSTPLGWRGGQDCQP